MKYSMTEQIVGAIAEVEGTDPEDLEIPLQNHVSTDAIRELVKHDSNSWVLQFETQDHVVEVLGDKTVIIDGRGSRALA